MTVRTAKARSSGRQLTGVTSRYAGMRTNPILRRCGQCGKGAGHRCVKLRPLGVGADGKPFIVEFEMKTFHRGR